MQRRIALALSLAITIITTFSIVTVGARTGLFGDGDSAAAIEQIAETAPPPVDVPVEQPAQPAPAYAAPADPVVVTEYVYVDEEVPASQPRAQSASAPKPTAAPKKQPTAAPAAEPTAPALEPTVPAVVPTAPVSAPTPPPAPTSVPTSPPAPPADPPPAAAPDGPGELEFTGTVTAIHGDIVTFRHGGATTDVRVTRGIDELEIGSRAVVHAIKVSSGYVAKEIEIIGGD